MAIVRQNGNWDPGQYFGNGIYTRELDFTLSPADQAKVVESVGLALGDRLGVAAVSGTAVGSGSAPEITSITSVGGGVWELTLKGQADTGYEFRFTSNAGTVQDSDVWSGFYVDDVVVIQTTP